MGQCVTSNPDSPQPTQTNQTNEIAQEKISLISTIPTPEHQKNAISDIVARNGNSQKGNIALNTKWTHEWIAYKNGTSKTVPGKIDNSSIDGGDGKTKLSTCDDGTSNGDFTSVNEEIWNYFIDIC